MTVHLVTTINTYVGLAADDKPTTEVPYGSTFLEADTPATFIYYGGDYATGTLTVADAGEADDTILLGSVTLTIVAEDAGEGEVNVGGSAAETAANIVAAVNGTDGANSANADIEATDNGDGTVTVTARAVGTDGNSLDSVYTATDASNNAFGAATLLLGINAWVAAP